MNIIKIDPNANGSHNNQLGGVSAVPDGWAEIPADMALPVTFPFVSITVSDGLVTSMTAGTLPDPAPAPAPDPTPTPDEDRDAMLIDLSYRLTLIELGVTN